jgi:hypothetical protein
VFALWIVNALLWELGSGVLLGEQRFTFVNVLLFARLVAIGVGYVALALAGALTVVGALATMAALDVTCAVIAMGTVLRRHGAARPGARSPETRSPTECARTPCASGARSTAASTS